LSRGSGYTVWLTKSEAVFGFRKEEMDKPQRNNRDSAAILRGGWPSAAAKPRYDSVLLGANPTAAISRRRRVDPQKPTT